MTKKNNCKKRTFPVFPLGGSSYSTGIQLNFYLILMITAKEKPVVMLSKGHNSIIEKYLHNLSKWKMSGAQLQIIKEKQV